MLTMIVIGRKYILEKNKIKNIIFDVGEVLIEYRWKDMLMDYGLDEESAIKLGEKMFHSPLWTTLDLGMMTDEEIIMEYKKRYPEDAEIISWFISHGEYMHVPRTDIWEKVHALKEQGYSIYLLSNYSKGLFDKHTKDATFLNDITGKVVSYQIHIAKPDKRIYQYLLEQYDLRISECVFLDDREENTKAAKEIGMKTITVTSRKFLNNLLNDWISYGVY